MIRSSVRIRLSAPGGSRPRPSLPFPDGKFIQSTHPFPGAKRQPSNGERLASLLPLLSPKLFPCEEEHQPSENEHYQSPPKIYIDEERALVGGSVRKKSEQRQDNAENDEQQTHRKTKVNVHNNNVSMLTKDQI